MEFHHETVTPKTKDLDQQKEDEEVEKEEMLP
jgi:hypothetical protein